MRILNAAMNEFAQKGYENASTNQIVKDAQISKGILFHYFRNKKELYLYLYDFAVETLLNDYFGRMDISCRDIFLRLKQISRFKLEIISKYPDIIKFSMSVQFEESGEVKQELQERNNKALMETYGKVYENIDISLFKEGIDVGKAIEIISWTLEGYAYREQSKMKYLKDIRQELEKIMAGIDPYLAILRNSLYK